MPDLILTLDVMTGTVLLAEPDRSPPGLHEQLAALLGPGRELGCARPLGVLPPPIVPARDASGSRHLRVAGYYHNSLVEGPGRRSSVLVAGCTLGCPGCWVPSLHPSDGGRPVPVDLLADASRSFDRFCARGLEPNHDRIRRHVEESLMLVTALNPHIGYEKSAAIALAAHRQGTSLRDAAIASGHLTAEQFDQWIRPEQMANPHGKP